MKIAISGIGGRMGRAILSLAQADPTWTVVCGLERPGFEGAERLGIPVVAPEACAWGALDGVIEFTSPQATLRTLDYTRRHKIPHVIGTTGFSPQEEAVLQEAALDIPLVWSGNMSVGVTLLTLLAKRVSRILGESYDIEILEMHHRDKVDAPSGTAMMLGRAVAEGRGVRLEDRGVFTRHGQVGPRTQGEIGFATLRGGSVVGDHSVFFSGPSEDLVLSHRAHGRDIFARGALRALAWLSGRPPGFYTMEDVLEGSL